MFATYAYNALSAAFIVVSSYIFWKAHVPPTPPANKTETKRQIPWIRLHGITIASITVSFMLLTAGQIMSGRNSNELAGIVCSRSTPSTGAMMGYALLCIGGIFRIRSQRALGKFFTWEISLKPDHKLCTNGPYSFVRHPSYLGLWMVRIAIDIVHSMPGSILTDCIALRYPLAVKLFVWEGYIFTVALIVWMSFRAKWEDELMKKEFGATWAKWAEQTPYRVVPYIY